MARRGKQGARNRRIVDDLHEAARYACRLLDDLRLDTVARRDARTVLNPMTGTIAPEAYVASGRRISVSTT